MNQISKEFPCIIIRSKDGCQLSICRKIKYDILGRYANFYGDDCFLDRYNISQFGYEEGDLDKYYEYLNMLDTRCKEILNEIEECVKVSDKGYFVYQMPVG